VVSILYGSIQAFTQTNARLILGYSSVAQLGFITLGIFAIDSAGQGAQGALLQAVNHGLVVAPLFFVIALLAERAEGSEDIRDYGGIAFRAPVLAVLFLIAALATLAMPGSANFAGEFLILLGAFDSVQALAFIASIGVVLASVYALRMYIRSMHNRVGPKVESFEIILRDGSCSCRWCWRSSRSRSTRSSRWTRARRPSSRRCRRWRSDDGSDRQATVKGPPSTGRRCPPDRADRRRVHRAAGRARALGVHPPQVVPVLTLVALGVTAGLVRVAVGHQRGDRRQRAGDRQPVARADVHLPCRRDRGRVPGVALGRRRRGGRGRVLRAAA
jgi:NADH:ubiquinone oxidoreductase subunit 5 (subunit L)/multisubunit Na+/H+ antiporter MnhA subunit